MPLTVSWLRLISSVLMNDGANVIDVGVPLLESLRCCRDTAPGTAWDADTDPFEYVLLCGGGVDSPGICEGEEKMADLGRIAWLAAGEPEGALAKGLLRRCEDPAPLKAIVKRPHQQHLAL